MVTYEKGEKERSTISCGEERLNGNKGLKLIAKHGRNKYYHVLGTNIVIMHVRDGKCILVDYAVKVYNHKEECILPIMLAVHEYGVYKSKGINRYREWVKRTDIQNVTISEDIIKLVHGYTREMGRIEGYTIHHDGETFNELTRNIFYTIDLCRYSHKKCIVINSDAELDEFMEILKEYDSTDESGFIIKD